MTEPVSRSASETDMCGGPFDDSAGMNPCSPARERAGPNGPNHRTTDSQTMLIDIPSPFAPTEELHAFLTEAAASPANHDLDLVVAVRTVHRILYERQRLSKQCQSLARLTANEDAAAAGFASLVARTDGWRRLPDPLPCQPPAAVLHRADDEQRAAVAPPAGPDTIRGGFG